MLIGLFFICLGILFILDNMGILGGRVWEFAWPIFLILLGSSIIIRRYRGDDN